MRNFRILLFKDGVYFFAIVEASTMRDAIALVASEGQVLQITQLPKGV